MPPLFVPRVLSPSSVTSRERDALRNAYPSRGPPLVAVGTGNTTPLRSPMVAGPRGPTSTFSFSVNDVNALEQRIAALLVRRDEHARQLASAEAENLELRGRVLSGKDGEEPAVARNQLLATGPMGLPSVPALDTAMFLLDSNAQTRAKLYELLHQRREMVITRQLLPPTQRARLEAQAGNQNVFTHPLLQGLEEPFANSRGAPASMAKMWKQHPFDDAVDSETLRPTRVGRVAASLHANEALYRTAMQQKDRGDDADADAHDNFGFHRQQVDYMFFDGEGADFGIADTDIREEQDGESAQKAQKDVVVDGIIVGTDRRTGKPYLKGITLRKLVERCSSPRDDVDAARVRDQNVGFRDVLLMTFKMYCSAPELLGLLIERFGMPPPPNATHAELDLFEQRIRRPVQLLVCAVVNRWLREHWHDFGEQPELLRRLRTWIEELNGSSSPLQRRLGKQLEVAARSEGGSTLRRAAAARHSKAPPRTLINPATPLASLHITQVDEVEMARQLSLRDQVSFGGIQMREFVRQAWAKADKAKKAPNITEFTLQFNRWGNAVRKSLLSESDVKERAKVLRKYIDVGYQLYKMQNFASSFAIVGALNDAAVQPRRLRLTWAELSSRTRARFEQLESLFSANKSHATLRAAQASALLSSEPSLPFVGLFLSDLTFAFEGNPDFLPRPESQADEDLDDEDLSDEETDEGADNTEAGNSETTQTTPAESQQPPQQEEKFVNFHKYSIVASCMDQVKRHQQRRYNFQRIDVLHDFIESLCEAADGLDGDDFWHMSQKLETKDMHREAGLLQ